MLFLFSQALPYFNPKEWPGLSYCQVCGRLLELRVGWGGAEFEAGLCPIQIAWNVSMQMTNVSSVDFI